MRTMRRMGFSVVQIPSRVGGFLLAKLGLS